MVQKLVLRKNVGFHTVLCKFFSIIIKGINMIKFKKKFKTQIILNQSIP